MKIRNYKKPVLNAGCATRSMAISAKREEFERQLIDWIHGCVLSRTINPKTGKPWRREVELVKSAPGVDEIFDYARSNTQMALEKGQGLWTVRAHFYWGRLSDGQWWVRGVGFSIRDSAERIERTQRRQLRQDLEDKAAEEKVKQWPLARDLSFATEEHIDEFDEDVKAGYQLVKNNIIEKLAAAARKASSMPKNPFGQDFSDPSDTPKTILGKIADEVPGVGFLKKTGQGWVSLFRGDIRDGVENLASAASEVLDKGIDAATGLAGAFFEAFTAHRAGEVSKIRSRAYKAYAAGLVSVLALAPDQGRPTEVFEARFYAMGQRAADGLNPTQRYQIQLALMHYASTHPINAGWSVGAIVNYEKENWLFPDDYRKHWTPDILYGSLTTQLLVAKYQYK
jgi:hypothetical protein